MHTGCASTSCCLKKNKHFVLHVSFLSIYFFDRVQLFIFKKVSLVLVSIVCMVSKNKGPYYCVQEIFAFKTRNCWVHTLMKYAVHAYALDYVVM